ncbi:unnamed protein product [Nesidiocoris tenuis]|uniref:Peptidase S9 prolyl oligopeptidase catalytic domain-containing protein n=1 Tax=Nesidiocoris tenuis TaxID=355587 RepID=A0A6H5GFE1_9HEMI|nr:unnamed protein product [Nesidiocoris tenuis]
MYLVQQLPLNLLGDAMGREWIVRNVASSLFDSLTKGFIRSSREELLLLERKRLTTLGITSYELDPPSGKIVFPAGGSLYQCVDSPLRNGTLFPSELRTGTVGAKLTPEICPSNPDLVAYVSNCDIWLSHEASGTSERLTYAHRGTRNLADDPLSCGTPSYVIQEEFSRYEGFWWQPESKVRWRQVSSVPLTSGDWPVVDEGLWVDSLHSLVYFIGLKESPLERHLYVVSLEAPEQVRLLTHTGSSYTVDINSECNIAVATYSSVNSPPACMVFRISHTDSTVEGVTLTPIGHLVEPQAVLEQPIGFPEIYSHEISSGDVVYAMVFRPHGAVPSVKYPTVLNVYGGPEVQIVTNTFKDMRYLRMHLLASQGYCVVSIDSRGSYNRGVQFESHIKHRMGTVELDDQIEMLVWLSNEIGLIDMSRVAIFGWSYGGYLSLMGIAQYPDVFKVAVAGAPVTNWALYDTGYTERYMDLPNANPQGYKAGSILNYVNQFPNEEGRLLIVHGLVDDNVHFTHTSSLITQLVRKGKPYQLQVYPCERHSLRSLDASKHYETTLLNFLAKHL